MTKNTATTASSFTASLSASATSRRGRFLGIKGLEALALALTWGEHNGVALQDRQVAALCAKVLKEAIALAMDEKHEEAARKVSSVRNIIRRRPSLVAVKVIPEGDRVKRPALSVIEYFEAGHFRVAQEVAIKRGVEKAAYAAKLEEAKAAKAAREAAKAAKVKAA